MADTSRNSAHGPSNSGVRLQPSRDAAQQSKQKTSAMLNNNTNNSPNESNSDTDRYNEPESDDEDEDEDEGVEFHSEEIEKEVKDITHTSTSRLRGTNRSRAKASNSQPAFSATPTNFSPVIGLSGSSTHLVGSLSNILNFDARDAVGRELNDIPRLPPQADFLANRIPGFPADSTTQDTPAPSTSQATSAALNSADREEEEPEAAAPVARNSRKRANESPLSAPVKRRARTTLLQNPDLDLSAVSAPVDGQVEPATSLAANPRGRKRANESPLSAPVKRRARTTLLQNPDLDLSAASAPSDQQAEPATFLAAQAPRGRKRATSVSHSTPSKKPKVTPSEPKKKAPPKPKANPRKKPRARKVAKKVSEDRDPAEDVDGVVDDVVDDDAYAEEETSAARKSFRHGRRGWDDQKPVIDTIKKMFEAIADCAMGQGIENVIKHLKGVNLLVGTMCSGSESPILGMHELQRVLQWKHVITMNFEQAFAAEIHPAKAAFIDRLDTTNTILRDIIEFSMADDKEDGPFYATTSYGGKVLVDGQLDLLIAGFACDDFSLMNNHRKTLQQKGESGDTFHAIVAYLRRFKPRLVVLENVCSAPWIDGKITTARRHKKDYEEQTGIDEHLRQAGYWTLFLRVDSKDFYVPHTRQRGYMVAMLIEAIPESWNLDDMETRFRDVLDAFKSTPSAPAEAFMFKPDDPRLSVLKTRSDAVATKGRTAWEKCRVGHDDYRHAEMLGVLHPITHWRSDGSRILLDFHRAFAAMTERVCDSIDIAHLRNVSRSIDDRYYSRILELSQNVYRVTDITKNGLIGCCMPGNLLWSTVEGRRITGIEALRFQATPTHLVDYSNMSEGLLHDLAGNAMTSTVVTCIVLTTLIVYHEMLDPRGRATAHPKSDPQSVFEEHDCMTQLEVSLSDYKAASVASIVDLAAQTRKYCYCELQNEISPSSIQKCRICKQTACAACGKEPSHTYTHVPSLLRRPPFEFEHLLRQSIPAELDVRRFLSIATDGLLTRLRLTRPAGLTAAEWSRALNIIESTLDSHVCLRSIRRTWSWEVVYDSNNARVVLSISDDGVQWTLYSNVPDEPMGSNVGKYLRKFPIAQMRATGHDLLNGEWKTWIPEAKSFDVTILSHGELIESFPSERGLVQAVNGRVHSKVDLRLKLSEYDEEGAALKSKYFPRSVEGLYEAHPACAQSHNSFHALQSTVQTSRPVGLFMDVPLREGNPEKLRFVLSEVFDRLEYGQYRPCLAEVVGWKQPILQVTDEELDGNPWKEYRQDAVTDASLVVYGFWSSMPRALVPPPRSTAVWQSQMDSEHPGQTIKTCSSSISALELDVPLLIQIPDGFARNKWQSVDGANEEEFWSHFSWLFKSSVQDKARHADNTWHPLTDDVHRCLVCAPEPPHIFWIRRKAAHIVDRIKPYEDPEEASSFERAMRSRPAAFSPVFCLEASDPTQFAFRFRLGIDPMTLAHRAKSLLPDDHLTKDLELSWRLVTDDVKYRTLSLQPFQIPSTKHMQLGPDPFKGKTIKKDGETITLRLFPEQNRAFQWMKHQEDNPPTFIEEEVVEDRIPELGYRLEGRAIRKKRVPVGVLAHQVGFGKTLVSLALIQENSTTDERVEAADATNPSGLVPVKATLIIVPLHLCDQWSAEASKFLARGVKVLVIKKIQNLKKHTLQDFKDADIVIVAWNVFTTPSYFDSLAQFAGMMPPAANVHGRLLRTWYETALERLKSNLVNFQDDPATFEDHLKAQFAASASEATSVDVPVPSKHVTGAAYKNSDARKAAAEENDQEAEADDDADQESEVDEDDDQEAEAEEHDGDEAQADQPPGPTAKVKGTYDPSWKRKFSFNAEDYLLSKAALFELFSWHRIILDEYTYSIGHLATIFEKLVGSRKWIASGTPDLQDFEDVKAIARLVGIHLGIDDFSSLKEDVKNIKLANLTPAEQFLAQRGVSSAWFRQNRHELAQRFLNDYATRDAAECEDIPLEENIVLVPQSPAEMAIYFEQQQAVVATNFQTQRKNFSGGHRDDVARELGYRADGREMLIMRAASYAFHVEEATTFENGATDMCSEIASLRASELDQSLAEFQTNMEWGFWLRDQIRSPEKLVQLDKFIARILGNHLGDTDVTNALSQSITNAEDTANESTWEKIYLKIKIEPKKAEHQGFRQYPIVDPSDTNDSNCPFAKELRVCISILNRKSQDILARQQSSRYFRNILDIQNAHISHPRCDVCLQAVSNVAKLELLVRCGHTICHACMTRQITQVCIVEGCNASNNTTYQRLNGSCLVDAEKAKDKSPSKFGSKIDQIVKLIKSLPSDEKVLMFVQYKNTENKIKEALQEAEIKYSDLKHAFDASLTLESFKLDDLGAPVHDGNAPVTETKKRAKKGVKKEPKEPKKVVKKGAKKESAQVLILSPEDATAAGGNIQVAAHQIHVGSLYTTGSKAQTRYESAKTQAIGRSRRHGQTRTVKVYYFLTVNTIDVDYFESREKKLVYELTSADEEALSYQETKVLARDPAYQAGLQLGRMAPPVPGSRHGPLASASSGFVTFDGE